MLSHIALERVIEMSSGTLLDVGSGPGEHALRFAEAGIDVTAIDIVDNCPAHDRINFIQSNWDSQGFVGTFDIVWCSHVLEHQLNVNDFLLWLKDSLKDDGILAITVPPMKHEIVSGHYTVWNAGLLVYNLVMAGFDCKEAQILSYGYNISVIVMKKEIHLPELKYHYGDISNMKEFFPKHTVFVGDTFFGDIQQTNWG